MSLNAKQAEFTRQLALLITWGNTNNHPVILAEAYRTEQQARWYAEQGRGIINSNHRLKLAADLFAVVDGKVSWDIEAYEALGWRWKLYHPLARWGGDFNNRDAVHFSFEHQGRA